MGICDVKAQTIFNVYIAFVIACLHFEILQGKVKFVLFHDTLKRLPRWISFGLLSTGDIFAHSLVHYTITKEWSVLMVFSYPIISQTISHILHIKLRILYMPPKWSTHLAVVRQMNVCVYLMQSVQLLHVFVSRTCLFNEM